MNERTETEQRDFEAFNVGRFQVLQGAALLDEKVPDWAEKINIDLLLMSDPCYCILGQLFGDYGSGSLAVFEFDGTIETQFAHGFDTRDRYDDLRIIWVQQIEKRTAGSGAT